MQNTNPPSIKPVLSISAAFILISGFLFLGAHDARAQDAQNKLNVTVNISEKAIIDITPAKLQWGQGAPTLDPGTRAGPSLEANGRGRVQVENLGSVNITQVWFNSSSPTQRPFGTANPDNYDAGNFISVDHNDSDVTDQNQFIDRAEFGLDQPSGQDIIYVNAPSGWDYGRFRNTSFEYFWTVDDEETGAAPMDGATFRIGYVPHTETQTGAVDFGTDGGTPCDGGDNVGGSNSCNSYTLTNVSDSNGNWWAVTDIQIGARHSNPPAPDTGGAVYCAAMNASQVVKDGEDERPKVHFIKWNPQHPAVSGSDCSFATNYTIGSNSPTGELPPGGWETFNIRASVPYGVPAAPINSGNIFVLANSQ